jgi:hypothetical protein
MDQRREPRFVTDQSVVVTVFGDPEMRHPAKIRNASPRGLSIEIPCEVPPTTAIKIELDDAIMLGEAVYCQGSKGSYLLGVELDQVLCGLTELGKRLQEFATTESSGGEVAYAVNHRQRQHRQQTEQQ